MNETEFWHIIEVTKIASTGDGEKQVELLTQYLSQLSEGDILDFDYIYRNYLERADKFSLWDAAYLIRGGCSEDGFYAFRGWLIAQGQVIYENAVADPDTLAEVVELGGYPSLELLNYSAIYAYKIKTGLNEMPIRKVPSSTPTEHGIQSDNYELSHPKLYAKFTPYWDDPNNF